MRRCTFSNDLVQKKLYKNHHVDEIMIELSKFGKPKLFRIRHTTCDISYLVRISTILMYSANGMTAKTAAEEMLGYIHDMLGGACGLKHN